MSWKGLLPMIGGAAKQGLASVDKTKLLFISGVMGVAGTGICAAKAAPEAARRVEEIKFDDFNSEMTEGEHRKYKVVRYLKEVAPLYLPAVIFGVGAVISFGMSNKQLTAKVLAASAAATTAERLLESYSEKTLEIVGEEVEHQIQQAVADDIPDEVIEKASNPTELDVANMSPHMNHDELWFDMVTQRMFWARECDIMNAESTVNQQLLDVGVATIGDFYGSFPQRLDCSGQVCDALGWDATHKLVNKMDIIFGSRLDERTGLVMKSISYRTIAVFPRELERR